MSFRVKVVPVRERTENEMDTGELIVDNNYGDISTYNNTYYKKNDENEVVEDFRYKVSSTKKIESDLQTTNIQNNIIKELLSNKIKNLGTYNITSSFDIKKDLNSNILGSSTYINNKVKKLDEENIDEKFGISKLYKELLDNSNSSSYSYILRKLLAICIDSIDPKFSFNNSISISAIEDLIIKNLFPNLEIWEKYLDEMEYMLNEAENIFKKDGTLKTSIDKIYEEFNDIEQILKSKKFMFYNEPIYVDNENKLHFKPFNDTQYQTENKTRDVFNEMTFYLGNLGIDLNDYYSESYANMRYLYDNLNSDTMNNTFNDHFIASPLSANFDGDQNLLMLDSDYYRLDDSEDETKDNDDFTSLRYSNRRFIHYTNMNMINAEDFNNGDSILLFNYFNSPNNKIIYDNRFNKLIAKRVTPEIYLKSNEDFINAVNLYNIVNSTPLSLLYTETNFTNQLEEDCSFINSFALKNDDSNTEWKSNNVNEWNQMNRTKLLGGENHLIYTRFKNKEAINWLYKYLNYYVPDLNITDFPEYRSWFNIEKLDYTDINLWKRYLHQKENYPINEYYYGWEPWTEDTGTNTDTLRTGGTFIDYVKNYREIISETLAKFKYLIETDRYYLNKPFPFIVINEFNSNNNIKSKKTREGLMFIIDDPFINSNNENNSTNGIYIVKQPYNENNKNYDASCFEKLTSQWEYDTENEVYNFKASQTDLGDIKLEYNPTFSSKTMIANLFGLGNDIKLNLTVNVKDTKINEETNEEIENDELNPLFFTSIEQLLN